MKPLKRRTSAPSPHTVLLLHHTLLRHPLPNASLRKRPLATLFLAAILLAPVPMLLATFHNLAGGKLTPRTALSPVLGVRAMNGCPSFKPNEGHSFDFTAENQSLPITLNPASPPKFVFEPSLEHKPHHRIAVFVGSYNHVVDGVVLVSEAKRVFPGYNHVVDGVVLTTNRLVRYLLSQGHEVLVFSALDRAQRKKPVQHAGRLFPLPSFRIPGRPEYQLTQGLSTEAVQALEDFRPDILHLATPDRAGLQVLAWGQSKGLPAVCPYHTRLNVYFEQWKLSLFVPVYWRWTVQKFYGKCDITAPPTDAVKREIMDNTRMSEDQFELWPRGIDTDTYSPEHRCISWRRSHGIPDSATAVILVSRLAAEKGAPLFVEIMKRLKQLNNVATIVVGDGPLRKWMQHELPDGIFLGSLSGSALAIAYASADIFLFPSFSETWGSTTLEAMASGLPVVVSHASGQTVVEDEVTGYLVKNEMDVDDYASRLLYLIQQPTIRKAMGEKARMASFHWSWESALQKMSDFYDRVSYGVHDRLQEA
eukprot:CAMPEP_0198366058 /NCGR_PEP_ID=MMETSP1450-20131203/154490_1 /TAXON_ID=753684 ORGANISM="Madagascaria erythrocladiodes, Strain CCMP3234" /NCGR_SAMPLE_ID=MMETSP1450 /ASSEMBLY_ACC=CAM_ASM_001115 /LENGTH=534 /DNA_ID=CAMNT_0044073523 /DNA_START=357 /DNA_END=1962 /DNA_ORIENTATION=+